MAGPTASAGWQQVKANVYERVGEQHVKEDLGRIPTACDWLRAIKPEPWMMQAGRLPDVEPCASGTNGKMRGNNDD